MFYNLQICRAIAAIMVMFAHATHNIDKQILGGFWLGGWCGVDFFFVLSGFIIYYTNQKNMGDRQKLAPYFAKRLIRIYPIHWLYLSGLIGLHFLVASSSGAQIVQWIQLDAWGYFASFSLYPTSVANDVDSIMPINPVSYTLAYELVFYGVFALTFLFPRRFFVAIMAVWLAFIVLGALNILPANEYFLLSVALTTRNIEFFYGCFIAYLVIQKPQIFRFSTSIFALIIGFISLLISWLLWLKGGADYVFLKKHSFIFFALPFSLIIFGALGLEGDKAKNWLQRQLIFLGDASYTIYLMHFIPIIALNILLHKVGLTRSLPNFLLICLFLIAFGALLYRFIEKPLTAWLTKKIMPKIMPKIKQH